MSLPKFSTYLSIIFFFISGIVLAQNSPPEITATGDQVYCPGTAINIATTVTIIDTDDTETEAMFIQISSGYQNGEDTLTLTGTHPTITTVWNATTGKLELNSTSGGEVLYTDFITAIEAVVFNSTNTNVTGDRDFSITVGDANYLPSSDHYYEYVSDIGITWTDAKVAAEARTYFGLQGYLATLETADEAQLSGEQAEGAGWIGGSDEETEGEWKWVTGPNPGVVFWNGVANGSTPPPLNYANWNNGEPNQLGDEDYAHITAQSIGIPGSWNDLTNTGEASGDYQPKGYVVEYGGSVGDPILNLSASTSIHIPEITNTIANSICGTGSVLLEATSNIGVVNWYDSDTSNTVLFTGNTFTTPSISSTTSYFVSAASDATCTTGVRTLVLATVNPIPTIDSTSGDLICFNGTGNLQATSTTGSTINWYATAIGGPSLGNGTSFATPSASTTTIYYVDASTTFCTTLTRTPVELTVHTTPAPTGDAAQSFCDIENAIITNLTTITGTNIQWYDALTGGTLFTGTETLVNGQTYFASQNDGTCESIDRLSVLVNVYTTVIPTSISPLLDCDNNLDGDDTNGFIIFDLTQNETDILNGQSATNFTLTYFIDAGYLNLIGAPTTFTNSVVNGQTIYVRMTNNLNAACFSDTSFEIEVFELPTILDTYLFKNCDVDGDPNAETDFNLDEANDFITLGNTSLTVTYYSSFTNANDGVSPIPPLYNNSNGNTVYARVETADGCHRVSTITLQVSTTSFSAGFSVVLDSCDDDNTIDGLHLFDLSDASADLIADLPPGQNLTAHYYRTLEDAQQEKDEILPQDGYMSENAYTQFNGTDFEQTIFVRVESDDNGECFGLGGNLTLIVHPRPEFEVDPFPEGIVCLNLPPITLQTYDPSGVYTYSWTGPNGFTDTGATTTVSSGGTYTVIATSTDGNNCESLPHPITINESIIASIDLDDVTITDDSDNNTITINNDLNNLGIGDYVFALDDINGPYQDDPFFDNVAPGIHTIYVQDKNNCGIAQLVIAVIGFPKFFTPNNDSENDTWQIKGVSDGFFTNSTIYIFDRYGKMIANVDATGEGWDGLYNGEALPSNDYWFTAELIDSEGNIRNRKGHFSLVRR